MPSESANFVRYLLGNDLHSLNRIFIRFEPILAFPTKITQQMVSAGIIGLLFRFP